MQYNGILNWIKSNQGQDFKEVLDFVIKILLFLWLLKNHKIIKK